MSFIHLQETSLLSVYSSLSSSFIYKQVLGVPRHIIENIKASVYPQDEILSCDHQPTQQVFHSFSCFFSRLLLSPKR